MPTKQCGSVDSNKSDCVSVAAQVGWGGYLNTHEKYFYCLDALPIFIAFCVYSVLHFDRYLDAPLALRLPTSAKQIVVKDISTSEQAPSGHKLLQQSNAGQQ